MRLVAAELVESRQILPGQWIQSFHAPELATGSRAGQFVHVRTGDYSGLVLRRPFSINTADPATGIVTLHFRAVGRGTEWMTRVREGERIDMLGPLGRPFEVDPRSHNLLLVAGGLGMAGVRMLADEAVRGGRKVTILFGALSASHVYPSSLLPDEVEYVVATDDGSLGYHGFVTELVPEYEAWADQAWRRWRPAGATVWVWPSSAASAADRRIREAPAPLAANPSCRFRWNRTWVAQLAPAWAAPSSASMARSESAVKVPSSRQMRSPGIRSREGQEEGRHVGRRSAPQGVQVRQAGFPPGVVGGLGCRPPDPRGYLLSAPCGDWIGGSGRPRCTHSRQADHIPA